MDERHGGGTQGPGLRVGWRENAGALEQPPIVGEILKALRRVGKVGDRVKCLDIAPNVTLDEPRVLPRATKLGEAPAQGRQETEPRQGAGSATAGPASLASRGGPSIGRLMTDYRIIRLRTP
jgi:hypothetical protein